MLPSGQQARNDFARYRDQRNLHRRLIMDRAGADLKAAEFPILAMEAEMTGLREQLDFMRSEGMLSDAQIEAAQNCIAWGEALLTLIPEEGA